MNSFSFFRDVKRFFINSFIVLIATLFISGFFVTSVFSGTTETLLVAWNFSNNPDDAIADGGVAMNSSKVITGVGVSNVKFGEDTTKSVRATGWADGVDSKYWEIEFETTGYKDISLSSKQRSSNKGPMDFKVQYKVGGGSWSDVLSGNVVLADDWTSGVLTDVALPTEVNDASSVSVRWIVTSPNSVDEGEVSSLGASNIDDIVVKGIAIVVEVDTDGDGVADDEDNCPSVANDEQIDTDGDGLGDVCDDDIDGDGVYNTSDNCLMVANPMQEDVNEDGVGDACRPINNISPVANSGSFTVTEGLLYSGAVSGSDADDDVLIFELITAPVHGTMLFYADGSFTYTADLNYVGEDSFTFKANDGLVDSGLAYITINITSSVTVEEPTPVKRTGGGGALMNREANTEDVSKDDEVTEDDTEELLEETPQEETEVNKVPVPDILGATSFRFLSDLSKGVENSDVIKLQERLRQEGYFTHPTNTGYFGSITFTAVQAYQRAKGLPDTGFVGPMTRERFNNAVHAPEPKQFTKTMSFEELLELLITMEIMPAEKKELALGIIEDLRMHKEL